MGEGDRSGICFKVAWADKSMWIDGWRRLLKRDLTLTVGDRPMQGHGPSFLLLRCLHAFSLGRELKALEAGLPEGIISTGSRRSGAANARLLLWSVPLESAGGTVVAPNNISSDGLCLPCPSLSFLAQTLYSVRAEISPPPGTELCKTGSLCSLEVSITRLSDLSDADKDEALTEREDYFSTKLMYEGGSRGCFPLAIVLIPAIHKV